MIIPGIHEEDNVTINGKNIIYNGIPQGSKLSLKIGINDSTNTKHHVRKIPKGICVKTTGSKEVWNYIDFYSYGIIFEGA